MMRPVYQFPIWAVGLSLAILAIIGTILLELGVRIFVSAAFRRQHNDIAAAIFSIIGVTYAVLLAFVAMLAWDGFNKAKAASNLEAVLVLVVSAWHRPGRLLRTQRGLLPVCVAGRRMTP